MDVPLQIIDRYKHLQENKLAFGKMRSTLIAWLVQKLLVNVQEAENGYDSLWHRESHILPLRYPDNICYSERKALFSYYMVPSPNFLPEVSLLHP